jgi:tRNA threonylcarbamoyladenosine biosynthesis protein TsaB
MIIALKTDQPQAVVCVLNPEGREVTRRQWHAHRTLARDLLGVIRDELKKSGSEWKDISGVIIFSGPGSFTGLRIGASVANTIAHELKVPIVGVTGDNWLADGVGKMTTGQDDKVILPEYGAEPNITKPKK